jgi:hypothetical protein
MSESSRPPEPISENDFEFDFFEDEPRQEPPEERQTRVRRPGGPGGGPPPPRRRGPGSPTPLLRLAGLIGVAILVIVLFALWIKSCSGPSKADAYKSYMTKVAVFAKNSEGYAKDLSNALTTPGIKIADLRTTIQGIAQNQQTDAVAAAALKPPAPLTTEQLSLVEALNFRVGGLNGLAATFQRTANTKDPNGASILFAKQAQRLTTSDVVWSDLFRDKSVAAMQKQGVAGVPVPASNFTSDPDFASTRYWLPIVQRLTGSTTGPSSGGLHGTGLVQVKALPKGTVLDANAAENTVVATTDLRFAVTVKDTGDSQEVKIKVTLTIQQQPSPIQKTQLIQSINPGQEQTVIFGNLGQVQFATRTTLKVDVALVPGESNSANNSAQFPVIFSLG